MRISKTAVRALAGAVLAGAVLTPTSATAAPTSVEPTMTTAAATSSPPTGPDSMSVTRLYRAFFLRDADGGGLAHWQAHVKGGYPLPAVADDFARSPEFQHRYGSLGDGAFVDLVYRNVLSRSPDAAGKAHWTGALRQGLLTRGGVMLSFSDSAEYKARTGLVGTTSAVAVTGSSTNQRTLVITDRSGRNLSRVVPTLAERNIHVRLTFPTGTDGRPRTDRPLPVQVEGTYRSGAKVLCNDGTPREHILACVGFPLMDQAAGVNWGDIPNHAADVGEVLDHLMSDPGLAGLVDDERIVYSGSSMGGITGLYFAAPATHDPRIRAVLSRVGFAPFSIPEIAAPVTWNAAPAVLMLNAHDDPSIPYDLARRTVEQAGAGRVELVTIREGGHDPRCPPADDYGGRWLWHHMFDSPRPSPSTLTGCAVPGLLPGGTTGYGLAAPMVR